MNIAFYGGSPGPSTKSSLNGTSFLFPMFGTETSFQLNPSNDTCKYRPKFKLDPTSSSTGSVKIPAMNYTITLLDNSLPAPEFIITSCPAYTPCFCGSSKTPFKYMTDANLLNQTFSVTEVNSTVNMFQFYYRTGLCYEVIGSDQFSLIEGVDQNKDRSLSCFPQDIFYMDKTDGSPLKTKKLTVKLFERYPEGVSWFTLNDQKQYITNKWTNPPLVNWFIENSNLAISDQVSGSNSNVEISYNTTLVTNCPDSKVCHSTTSAGNLYTIKATYILPIFPFDLKFEIYARRSGSDGIFQLITHGIFL